MIYTCPICGVEFERFPSQVRCSEPMCSRECSYKKKITRKTVPCSFCGKPVYVFQCELERSENHFCNTECKSKFQRKETVKNYRVIRRKRGTRRIHRLIAEICLGRSLPLSLVVHHVNGSKFDNRLSNLEVHTIGDHNRLHRGFQVKPIWSGREHLEYLQSRPRKLKKLRKELERVLGNADVDYILDHSQEVSR